MSRSVSLSEASARFADAHQGLTLAVTESERPKTLDEFWDHYVQALARISANLVLIEKIVEQIETELEITHDGFEAFKIPL